MWLALKVKNKIGGIIVSLKIGENRYKQKYRLTRILGVIAIPYSLQSFRYYM